MIYAFGDYQLDTDRHELRHAGDPCPLEPQVYDVLLYLIRNRDRVVPKQELLDHVWPETFVSEAALYNRLRAARQAVGDSGRAQRVIRTVPKQGYRFSLAVTEKAPAESVGLTAQTDTSAVLDTPSPARSTRDAERKLVTALCGTLANAEALAEQLGFDALDRIRQTFMQLAKDAGEGYAGTLQPYGDDGFLALFGIPVAYEDHPRRAILVALGLRQRVRDAVSDLALPGMVELSVRMGIHTGLVRLRGIEAGVAPQGLVMGETTDLAVRLQSMAASDTLLVSAATLHLLRGEVHREACEPVRFGDSSQMMTYTVHSLGRWQPLVRQYRGRSFSRFVGRERELQTLCALLAQVEDGRGQVVGIIGEPGMGKSRLLYEFAQRPGNPSLTYVEGHCLSYGSATPYLPLVGIVRQLCGIGETDAPETTAAKVRQCLDRVELDPADTAPYMLQLLGMQAGAEALAALDPHTLKIQTFDKLRRFILHHSQQQALIIAVENLHWMDATTEEWLTTLIEHLAGAALLLVLTYRPGYRPPWIDKSYVSQLSLSQLAAHDSLSVVHSVLQSVEVPEALLQELVAKAAGNPFFLEELAWAVIEQGDRMAPSAVPDTIQAVLSARMDRLPPETKHLMQVASVIGREVPYTLLQAVTELHEVVIDQSLMDLQAAELVYKKRTGSERVYTFKHALTQDVAYESLLPARRRELHAQIVGVIEQYDADHPIDQLERLAHHALQGELWGKAVSYFRQAGTNAMKRSSQREAVESFEQALNALSHLPETRYMHEQAVDLRLALRSALQPSNDFERILEYLREAESLATALDDPRRLAEVSLFLSRHFSFMGAHDQAIAAAQRALTLTPSGDITLNARANQRLGMVSLWQGKYHRAIDFLRQSIDCLDGAQRRERFGTVTVVAASSCAWLAWCNAELGLFPEGTAIGDEGLQIAKAVNHPASLIVASWGRGILALRQGRLPRALALLECAIRICRAVELPNFFPRTAAALGSAYVMAGRVADAMALLSLTTEQSVVTEMSEFQIPYNLTLGKTQLLTGHPEGAHTLAKRALALARDHQERGNEAYAHHLLAQVAIYRDPSDVAKAETHYQQALALAEELGMRPLQTHCHRGLGMLYGQIEQPKQARTELSTAIDMYREMGMTFWLPQVEAQLAKIALQ